MAGVLDVSLVGVLASPTDPLARADIPPLALSTFDTDYGLVKEDDLRRAIEALEADARPGRGRINRLERP